MAYERVLCVLLYSVRATVHLPDTRTAVVPRRLIALYLRGIESIATRPWACTQDNSYYLETASPIYGKAGRDSEKCADTHACEITRVIPLCIEQKKKKEKKDDVTFHLVRDAVYSGGSHRR